MSSMCPEAGAEGASMIEFLHTYGLWIALAGVFIVMNRFGMRCCGGGHRHLRAPQDEVAPRENVQGDTPSRPAPKSGGSCH